MLRVHLLLRSLSFQARCLHASTRRLPPAVARPAAPLRLSSCRPVCKAFTTLGATWSSGAATLAPRRRPPAAAMPGAVPGTPVAALAAAGEDGDASQPTKRTRGSRSRSASTSAAAVAAAAAAVSAIDGAAVAKPAAVAAAAATSAAQGAPVAGPASPAEQAGDDTAAQGEQPGQQQGKGKGAGKGAGRPRPPAKSPSRLVLDDQAALEFKAQRIAELLGRLYPNPPIPLDHGSHFQLLCAVLLSAQTTDKKVNECTPALFQLAPDAAAMAAAELEDIAACIRQLGLAPTKARNLKAMSQLLMERHEGQVPASMEALEALPGVGHKTASVVMCQAFGQDAFPVDTHIHRLAQRWGLTDGRSVEQTEADLKLLFQQHLWKDLHLQVIFFGRERCPAQRHDPMLCPVCSWAAVPPYNKAGVSPQKAGGPRSNSGSSAKVGKKAAAVPTAGQRKRAAPAGGAAVAKRGRKAAADQD